jgi:hypothetical protein
MRRTPWSEYSPAYWACIVGAFVFLAIDIAKDVAWTNVVTIVLIAAAVFLRPGGVRGPR